MNDCVREQPTQVACREQLDVLPLSLLVPPQREVAVEPALCPLREELEERKLIMGLDREVPVRRWTK